MSIPGIVSASIVVLFLTCVIVWDKIQRKKEKNQNNGGVVINDDTPILDPKGEESVLNEKAE